MIPASYIWIRISLVLPAIAVETASVKEGFARSWALTRKSYFSLISKWLLLLIFQIPVYFLSVYLSEIFVDAQFFYDLIFLLIDPILIGYGTCFVEFDLYESACKEGGVRFTIDAGKER